MQVSKKILGVEYPIRDVVLTAQRAKQKGLAIDYLNIGDPVRFGFQPPDNVKAAIIDAINRGDNYYSSSEGLLELREEIAKKENSKGLSVNSDDIVITHGVSEAFDMVMSSIIEEGNHVLLPGPYYPPYASYIRLRGGIPVEFAVDLDHSTPDIDDIISKITPKTVAICLVSPNNPTGAVFNEKSLKALADIADKNNLYIICDEIYDQIVFDDKFVGIGSIASDLPIILLNGFSKAHLMSGWRLGYIAFNRSSKLDKLREHLPKLAEFRVAINMPVQYAALESLRGPQDYVANFVREVKQRRDLVIKRLNEMPGLSCPNPRGTFYAFPKINENPFASDKEFVTRLIETKGVLTVPGSVFGKQYGSNHFRLVYLADIDTLDSAMNKIEEFVNDLHL